MPIHKKGPKQDKSCYRLVLNSEASASVVEAPVNKQLVDFLQKNNLLSEQQFAIAGRGTTACLRDAYAHWMNNINDSKYSVVTSYDFKSAFGMCNIEILDKKLEASGTTKSSR